MRHVAECLSLPPTTFEAFRGNMDRLKFIKYPQSPPGSQGVGPHKDSSGLFTFLSQDDTGGLQVLNKKGEWIDAPPIEGSLVVNIQQGFEAITGGVCTATTHRVIVCSVLFYLVISLTLNRHPRQKRDIASPTSSRCGRTSPFPSSKSRRRILYSGSRHRMIARRGQWMCRASFCRHYILV
jgi:hypothetical protein